MKAEVFAEHIRNCIKQRGINALQTLIGEDTNPFKDECIPASYLLYEVYKNMGMKLFKKRDYKNNYHWWNKIGETTIDITKEQYTLEGKPVPSDDYTDATKERPMNFPSYWKRVEKLKVEMKEYIKANKLEKEFRDLF